MQHRKLRLRLCVRLPPRIRGLAVGAGAGAVDAQRGPPHGAAPIAAGKGRAAPSALWAGLAVAAAAVAAAGRGSGGVSGASRAPPTSRHPGVHHERRGRALVLVTGAVRAGAAVAAGASAGAVPVQGGAAHKAPLVALRDVAPPLQLPQVGEEGRGAQGGAARRGSAAPEVLRRQLGGDVLVEGALAVSTGALLQGFVEVADVVDETARFALCTMMTGRGGMLCGGRDGRMGEGPRWGCMGGCGRLGSG